MSRMNIVDAGEEVACPKCAHAFALSEGISRQAIERYAEDFDRSLAERATSGVLCVVGNLQGIREEGVAQLDAIAALPCVQGEDADSQVTAAI
jgi:hypothetical protein